MSNDLEVVPADATHDDPVTGPDRRAVDDAAVVHRPTGAVDGRRSSTGPVHPRLDRSVAATLTACGSAWCCRPRTQGDAVVDAPPGTDVTAMRGGRRGGGRDVAGPAVVVRRPTAAGQRPARRPGCGRATRCRSAARVTTRRTPRRCTSRSSRPRRGGTVVALGRGVHVSGRARRATCRLPDPEVSRRHVAVTVTAAGVGVRDLDSRNGTTRGATSSTVTADDLAAGDAVRVGHSSSHCGPVARPRRGPCHRRRPGARAAPGPADTGRSRRGPSRQPVRTRPRDPDRPGRRRRAGGRGGRPGVVPAHLAVAGLRRSHTPDDPGHRGGRPVALAGGSATGRRPARRGGGRLRADTAPGRSPTNARPGSPATPIPRRAAALAAAPAAALWSRPARRSRPLARRLGVAVGRRPPGSSAPTAARGRPGNSPASPAARTSPAVRSVSPVPPVGPTRWPGPCWPTWWSPTRRGHWRSSCCCRTTPSGRGTGCAGCRTGCGGRRHRGPRRGDPRTRRTGGRGPSTPAREPGRARPHPAADRPRGCARRDPRARGRARPRRRRRDLRRRCRPHGRGPAGSLRRGGGHRGLHPTPC